MKRRHPVADHIDRDPAARQLLAKVLVISFERRLAGVIFAGNEVGRDHLFGHNSAPPPDAGEDPSR